MHGRILIADDVATNRIIYKVKLGDAHYEPLLAADGQGCLAMARTEHPDLILLDLVLPDMPGTDVLRDLRADPATAAIPVMMLTARGQARDRDLALQLGATRFMAKPFSNAEVIENVRALVGA